MARLPVRPPYYGPWPAGAVARRGTHCGVNLDDPPLPALPALHFAARLGRFGAPLAIDHFRHDGKRPAATLESGWLARSFWDRPGRDGGNPTASTVFHGWWGGNPVGNQY